MVNRRTDGEMPLKVSLSVVLIRESRIVQQERGT